MHATYARIYLDNFVHNLNQVKALIAENVRICVPVKADAYGHGAVRIAQEAVAAGVQYLAVARVEEGIELRKANITIPILCFSLPAYDEIPSLLEYSITPFVFDEAYITELSCHAQKANTVLPVHLKIDTGMGRVGCHFSVAPRCAEFIVKQKNLYLEGVCTHFAQADSLSEQGKAYTKLQLDRFNQSVEAIKQKGINPGIVHAANSGATLLYPQCHFNMVRPGIVLYGYFPDEELKNHLVQKVTLKPVMELVSKITSIKTVQAGDYISYASTWQAKETTVIGVIPIGYADGLARRLSNDFKVSINTIGYPLVGRICMDQCMVNLGTHDKVSCWDEVVIFGMRQDGVDAASMAKQLDTIAYEVTCGISKRVERVYLTSQPPKAYVQ